MDSRRSSTSTYSTDVVSYIQVRVLGKGAHGRAVLYRNTTDDSLVVWKEISIEQNTTSEVQREIDILSMLDHPNIVTYYNHFVNCDTIFIEMEYANAGSLSKFLKEKRTDLSDSDIRWYFFQIIHGLEYLHKSQIIHRDIKSLNIFMTSSTLIKIGDFGISKVLLENEMAQTRVGTPAYMSPEVIQGQKYSTKSDIWSCGCVLFELISRTKLVKCSNELGMAMKIVNRDFQKISKKVDEHLQDLLNKLLKPSPEDRPTASEILRDQLWQDEQKIMIKKIHQLYQSNINPRPYSGDRRERSIVSLKTEVFVWGGGKHIPIKLEEFTQNECALQVSVGTSHFAVLTVEKNLYTWSSSRGDTKLAGQLGHGKNMYKIPHLVTCLKGINIKEVSCGAESTVCLSSKGEVYTCGSNYYGQLGVGSEMPDMVDKFIQIQVSHPDNGDSMFVRSISCGHYHIAAIAGEDDHLFSWGCGEYGRLGLNSEENTFVPTLVDLPVSNYKLKSIQCGPDNSFLVLKSNDRLMACGNNKCNKLGINVSAKGLMGSSKTEFSYDVPFETKFKIVRFMRDVQVAMISCGKTHTMILDEYNKLYIFGQNGYGQLGLGDTKAHPGINQGSKVFSGKPLKLISCGDNFCVATTFDNEIYAWGLADDGRLGLSTSCDQKFIAHPRPLFGSLYKCADLKSCGWHSIMITERVLETNTIAASANNSLSDMLHDSNKLTNTLSTESSNWPSNVEPQELSSSEHSDSCDTRTSELAPWLQAELKDAEYIPMNTMLSNNDLLTKYPSQEMYRCDCGCEKCAERIMDLEHKLTALEGKKQM